MWYWSEEKFARGTRKYSLSEAESRSLNRSSDIYIYFIINNVRMRTAPLLHWNLALNLDTPKRFSILFLRSRSLFTRSGLSTRSWQEELFTIVLLSCVPWAWRILPPISSYITQRHSLFPYPTRATENQAGRWPNLLWWKPDMTVHREQ